MTTLAVGVWAMFIVASTITISRITQSPDYQITKLPNLIPLSILAAFQQHANTRRLPGDRRAVSDDLDIALSAYLQRVLSRSQIAEREPAVDVGADDDLVALHPHCDQRPFDGSANDRQDVAAQPAVRRRDDRRTTRCDDDRVGDRQLGDIERKGMRVASAGPDTYPRPGERAKTGYPRGDVGSRPLA